MAFEKAAIILIHGLASKPPETDLHELWTRALTESLGVEKSVQAFQLPADVCRSAYWANAVPSHLEDEPTYVTKLRG